MAEVQDLERYDRARPSYPEALIKRIAAAGPRVLDVGCATGTEARQFRDAGCVVLGVEPDARMAAYATSSGVNVEVSTFEEWDPAGRSWDAVVAGTSWHWVGQVEGARKAADMLRPGGLLAPFWHATTVPRPVQEAFVTAFYRVAPDSPVVLCVDQQGVEGYRRILDQAADGIRRSERFGEPEYWTFDGEQVYTRDLWLEHVASWGVVRALGAKGVREIQQAVGQAIDAEGGRLTVGCTSVVIGAWLAA
ncbi:class I SAM-dependent methyltransferase [Kribbella sp. NPDC051137]|uniref:class I SAM-dependent methyltransferase n=1 Tax=Kribbella sp. NPDC051137 TaxID=3155045 RepID=UPI002F55A683